MIAFQQGDPDIHASENKALKGLSTVGTTVLITTSILAYLIRIAYINYANMTIYQQKQRPSFWWLPIINSIKKNTVRKHYVLIIRFINILFYQYLSVCHTLSYKLKSLDLAARPVVKKIAGTYSCLAKKWTSF